MRRFMGKIHEVLEKTCDFGNTSRRIIFKYCPNYPNVLKMTLINIWKIECFRSPMDLASESLHGWIYVFPDHRRNSLKTITNKLTIWLFNLSSQSFQIPGFFPLLFFLARIEILFKLFGSRIFFEFCIFHFKRRLSQSLKRR